MKSRRWMRGAVAVGQRYRSITSGTVIVLCQCHRADDEVEACYEVAYEFSDHPPMFKLKLTELFSRYERLVRPAQPKRGRAA